MSELDWSAIGISWIFSTITTLTILFISLCMQKRSVKKSKNEKQKVFKEPVLDDSTYIPNPFSKSAYAEWTSSKPLETSSPKIHTKHKPLMPLMSHIDDRAPKIDLYKDQIKSDKKRSKRLEENGINTMRNKIQNVEKRNDLVINNVLRNDLVINNVLRNDLGPLKFNKVIENVERSGITGSEMIMDLKKSPAEKRRRNRQRTRHLSSRSYKSDSLEAMQANITKETNLSNSQKNSDRQLYFVKCESKNSLKSNFQQKANRSEKPRKFDECVDETRITQLPPRPTRQSSSMLFFKESPASKPNSMTRCHSSSPPSTPSRSPSRKQPKNEKHQRLQLKVDELCYTSLPTFAALTST